MGSSTIPNLTPSVGAMTGAELFWGNLNGDDFRYTAQQIAFLAQGVFDIRAFGAQPSFSAAVNTAAVNAAIAAAQSSVAAAGGGAVLVPGYYQANPFTVPAGVTLIGSSPQSCGFYQNNTTGNFITIASGNGGLSGVGVICNVAATSGATVYVAANGVRMLTLSLFSPGTAGAHMFNGVQFDPVTGAEYWLDNFSIVGARVCIRSGSPTDSTSVSPPSGLVTNGQLSPYSNGVGILLHQNGGTQWTNIQCLFGLHGVQTFPGSGQYIFAQYFNNCFMDSASDDCWLFTTGGSGGTLGDVQLNTCWGASSSGGNGLNISGNAPGTVDGVTVNGGDYINNFKSGILFGPNASNVNIQVSNIFNNSQAGASAYPGVDIAAGTSNFMVGNCQCGAGGRIALVGGSNKQSYGIVVNTGASNHYNIVYNRGANVSGIVSDGGSGADKTVTGNLAA